MLLDPALSTLILLALRLWLPFWLGAGVPLCDADRGKSIGGGQKSGGMAEPGHVINLGCWGGGLEKRRPGNWATSCPGFWV